LQSVLFALSSNGVSSGCTGAVIRTLQIGGENSRIMTTRAVTVVNQLGLHARAAARFVHLATRFDSQIRVTRDAKVMDGKSIMGILLLAAGRGTTITITADGRDEADAVEALTKLVESGFGEESWNG
jgi:phosphocarrier protein HPr